jgi:hypothetical protein
MAGSKKGEKRGAAKGGSGMDGEVLSPDPTIRSRALPAKHTEEYMNDVYSMVHSPEGSRRIPPKALLWEAQDHFHQRALSFVNEARGIIAKLPLIQTQGELENFNRQLLWCEAKADEMYVKASDMAFKAAPYFHAKVTPDRNAPVADAVDLLALLIREIDDLNRGRPTWMPPHLKVVASSSGD